MIKTITKGASNFSIRVEGEIEQHRYDTAFTKEPETITWIETFMDKDDVFIDVGANIGVYSLFAASIHPQLRIYSVEPAFHNYFHLCSNIADNNFEQRIVPIQLALGDSEDVSVMSLSSSEVGSASHAIDSGKSQKVIDRTAMQHLIMAMPLDVLIERGLVIQPNHIKIDVDGFEEKVIAGMKKALANLDLRSILIEFDELLADTTVIKALLNAAGFQTNHPINQQSPHSRERRELSGNGHIKNVIYTRA